MNRFFLILLALSSLSISCRPTTGPSAPKPVAFIPACSLPFASIQQTGLRIDQQCGIDGAATPDSSTAKQNERKNNLCATGTPIELSFTNFDQLQQSAIDKNIPFGNQNLPNDRSVLANMLTVNGQQIGEGTVVALVGFVFDARHANTTFFNATGESVNCKSGDLDMNDIHIDLAESASLLNQTDECLTVTAEIIPHYRPASWDRFDVNPKTAVAAQGLPLKGAKVRISGQLFFDASHTPCVGGQGETPRRRSLWEIHPVYSIEVFDDAKQQFIALDEWARGK
jgi:hypothetical protein